MIRNSDENVTIESLSKHSIHDELPTVEEYFSNLNTFATLSIIVATLMFIFNLTIYFFTYKQSQKRVRKQYYNHTIILNGLYSIVSLSVLLAILIPKLTFICHTIMHLTFVFGSIIYYKLCYLYVEGEDNFLKESDSEILNIRTPPFCCCCLCLHPMAPTKKRLNFISYMVYQLPCIQFVIMLTMNVIFEHEVQIFRNCNYYFAPFMFSSILIAVWALNIVTRMVGTHLKEQHNMKQKFICLQLILIICKFQYIILNISFESVNFGGVYPITNQVYKQNIINLAIILEMLPLSLFAKWAYKLPTHL